MSEKHHRANTLRPQSRRNESYLNPLHDDVGEVGVEKVPQSEDKQPAWKAAKKKIEEFETKITEQFEDTPVEKKHESTMLRAPAQPTQEEWSKHQTTHAPFAAWCPHCLAATNVRRNYPKQGIKGRLVPDTEIGDGPTKVFVDYMYIHDRIGRYREIQHNPFYLVIVQHTCGRCWTYQVPNKGVHEYAIMRVTRVISEMGLVQFRYRSDKEPSIVAMIEESCKRSGRKGTNVTPPELAAEDPSQVDAIFDWSPADVPSAEAPPPPAPVEEGQAILGVPEHSHPGESASNGIAEAAAGRRWAQFMFVAYCAQDLACSRATCNWSNI